MIKKPNEGTLQRPPLSSSRHLEIQSDRVLLSGRFPAALQPLYRLDHAPDAPQRVFLVSGICYAQQHSKISQKKKCGSLILVRNKDQFLPTLFPNQITYIDFLILKIASGHGVPYFWDFNADLIGQLAIYVNQFSRDPVSMRNTSRG